jgi:hypothetical protein
LDQIPPGAFGVWNGAQRNGIFAYFAIVPKKTATEADKARFASVLLNPRVMSKVEQVEQVTRGPEPCPRASGKTAMAGSRPMPVARGEHQNRQRDTGLHAST